jgi:hypothetical protein
MNIFLDDIRTPKMAHSFGRNLGPEYSSTNKWTIVRDYFEFTRVVSKYHDKIKLVSFDHDLANYSGEKEWTGKDAADWLINLSIDSGRKFPDWYVHSDNVSGKKNIVSVILNYLRVVEGVDISDFRYYHNGMMGGVPV